MRRPRFDVSLVPSVSRFSSGREHRGEGDCGRRGAAMIVVMAAIALCLTLTVAFLQTQATLMQIDANVSRRDAALHAAQAGAAVALREMQSPGWAGVTGALSANVFADDAGVAAYRVTFEKAPADATAFPQEQGLSLLVRSVGTWKPAGDGTESARRTVEVLVRLQPRLAGRAVGAGDDAAADDLAPNPGDYDQIQQYALYAQRDTSLVLDPQSRIDGRLWMSRDMSLFSAPRWSGSIRNDFLDSVRVKHVSSAGPAYAHPFGANGIPSSTSLVSFEKNPDGPLRFSLDRLGVSHVRNGAVLAFPAADYAGWKRYRLYAGGFEYEAQAVGARLSKATLGPSAENPLGIFHREGAISLEDDVTIVGTLVSTGSVTIDGDSIHIASCPPRDGVGNLLFADAGQWPRLPAIVADSVEIERDVRARIEGAIIVQERLRGAGGDFEHRDVLDVDISGTATCRPIASPFSRVTIAGTQSLAAVRAGEQHAIWLSRGTSGSWHPIREVDPARRELTIVGHAEHASPTAFLIRRNRRRYVDIEGPLSGQRHELRCTEAWESVSSDRWDALSSRWKTENQQRQALGLPKAEFVDWLADPLKFLGWGGWTYPHTTYGLPLEPTFHLQCGGADRYRWSPPLFRPWSGPPSHSQHSGYRWKVLSWREMP